MMAGEIERFPYYHGTHLTEKQLHAALLLASMVLIRMENGDDVWEDWFNQAIEAIEHVTKNPYTFAQKLHEAVTETFATRLRVSIAGRQFPPHSPWGTTHCTRLAVTDDTALALYYKFYEGTHPYFTVHRDQLLEWLKEVSEDELGDERRTIKLQIEASPNIEYWLFYND